MHISLELGGKRYQADLGFSVDLSLGLGPGADNPSAFGIPDAEIQPIRVGDFVGSVAAGSGANCDVIQFCAHGNITHTECFGHISKNHESVADCIQLDLLTVDVITVPLAENGVERYIHSGVFDKLPHTGAAAVIVRTLPNTEDKKQMVWSGNNPPYFSVGAMQKLVEHGYTHLLTDLPSVDPESDGGALSAHHVWWQYPHNTRKSASITELIFVPETVVDGLYLLNLQFPKIHSDAAPSRAKIYPLQEVK